MGETLKRTVENVGEFFIDRADCGVGFFPMYKPFDCNETWKLRPEPILLSQAVAVINRVATVVEESYENDE